MSHQYTNALIHETSPYLLQHAHNPVNWEAWRPEILQRAKAENKPLLISIGYAACHWCHVMEKECFEDATVAQVMNANFISIKVDREERPDVDHIYMDALQLMTGSGGWPLNIIALPDGRPFWGGTYVKKDQWITILEQLSELYRKDPEKVVAYAENLADGIRAINLVEPKGDGEIISMDHVRKAVKDWSQHFDTFLGGYKRAPKFMMPVNLNFLLHYGIAQNDSQIMAFVNTTLTKMAWGGIFDHVGGGFSRYSVDTKWHIPHFEKMLYDNAQLTSLYAQAYAATGMELYKFTAQRTLDFVRNELMSTSFGFYSSLDADSDTEAGDLEEGAYYVWTEATLKALLGDNFAIFKDYFNINRYGHWEHENYVLIRDASASEIAKKHTISVEKLNGLITTGLERLQQARTQRKKPRLDDKILTSWNGMMLKGLVDAYRYFGTKDDLDLALKNAAFISSNLYRDDGGLYHNHKNGKSSINGYLEDYAAVIDAFTALYQITFDEQWLVRSKTLMAYCIDHFYEPKNGMFAFTSRLDATLIRRTIETTDNVVPASNSMMAKNLFVLAKYYPDENFEARAKRMLVNVQGNVAENAQSHANWMQLALFFNQPFYEIALVGEDFKKKAKELGANYVPNTIVTATERESTLALLQNRFVEGKTSIYVCQHGSCKLPQDDVKNALDQLRYQH